MAPTSHGIAGPNGRETFANGSLNGNSNGPPPSTLAAQLVENISASTRSSRPDETAELKRFFGIIEEVKNQPDILKTPKERMEHNHMLIYVYTRVVLETLRWDDPFADRIQLRADASRAVDFLKITIRETPDVLSAKSEPGLFLFRGDEPLWLWIFPKVLKMLGSGYCTDLRDEIDLFFRDVLLIASRTGSQWSLLPQFLAYFRSSFNAIINYFKELKSPSANRDVPVQLQLPPDWFLASIADGELKPLLQQCTYDIALASHALHHASGLLSIMAMPLLHHSSEFDIVSSFQEYIPWLFDAYFHLHETQVQWRSTLPGILPLFLENSLQFLDVLEAASSVDSCVEQKVSTSLVLLCMEMSTQSLGVLIADGQGNSDYKLLCLSLARVAKSCLHSKPISRLVTSQLIPALEKPIIGSEAHIAETDFWRCLELLRKVVTDPVPTSLGAEIRPDKFSDEGLRQQVNRLNMEPNDVTDAERQSKRRKVSANLSSLRTVTTQLHHLLGTDPGTNFVDLKAVLENKFQKLPEAEVCRIISLLGYVCCAADDTLSIHGKEDDGTMWLDCRHCQTQSPNHAPLCLDLVAKRAIQEIFASLVQLPVFLESRKPRVTAMTAIRRIAKHCIDSEFLDIEVSVIAQWCLKSLQSSVRELRIASGRTVATFLSGQNQSGATSKIVQKNRANVLSILRSLSEQALPQLTETCILAWSHVGSVIFDDQLNLVLVKLVEYLGSESIITSAAAFAEIVKLARSRGMTTRQFFEPFWRFLAFSATKDLTSRPKLTRLLAELLDMTIAELLLYLQKYALPWLVLTKKRDVIQRIAEARNEEEIWRPCLDESNLGPILALLLTQDAPDIQQYCMDLLGNISPHLNQSGGLLELLRIEPIGTTLELLKAAGDADEDRKTHIFGVLNKVASLMLKGSGELKSKKVHASGPFLQRYALALMAGLTQAINDVSNRTPSQERKRHIKAMEEMIRIGKHYIRIARPQISACLQAAMLYDDLRSAAFSCWATMLLYLEDVEALIETTFFLISHYWSSFDEETQKRSRDLIESLLEKEGSFLEATISKLPSFSHINYLSDIEGKLSKLRQPVDSRTAFSLLAERISHENDGVVLLALRELASYLQRQQEYLQASAVSEQPDSVVSTLARSLLDCSSRFNGIHGEISDLCIQCLGLVGCLDPNRVETVRAERQMVVKSNFEHSEETTDFVVYLLEEVLVKSFLSATDTKLQGFLSYAMQELLERADIKVAVQMEGSKDAAPIYRKWLSMSVTAREVLIPFLTSRYVVQPMAPQQTEYPIFRPGKTRYANWMRSFTLDLMRKPQAPFAELIFEPLCRVIRIKDLSTVEFLFPYVTLHIVVGEDTTKEQRLNVLNELLNVLRHEVPDNSSYEERENQKLYCEAVFRFIDYAMRWLQLKRAGGNLGPRDVAAMEMLQGLLDSIPAELISQRAVDCKAYARALFHLERHIRQVDEEKTGTEERDRLLQRLQDIYTQIDEPDGLEGISAHLHVLDVNQQVLSHRKAGRWAAAQTWYEIKLAEDPDNVEIQIDLLTCLKESGQHDVLLNYVEGIEKHTGVATINRIVPYAVEASWATGRWRTMEKFITKYQGDRTENFNVSIAQALLYLRKGWTKAFVDEMRILRDRVNASMNFSITSSLQACHEPMLKCHVLTDLELIAGINNDGNQHPQEVLKTLNRRLEVLGSYVNDKQFVLSIRRAAMELMRPRFGDFDISALWLSSARLARKTNSTHQSFNAVLHASQLGDDSATIENARLLWKEGHNRKAIQTLKSAIDSKAFTSQSFMEHESSEKNLESQQNMLTARAQLLLAKWLDSAGQTHATALREHYRSVPKNYGTWEKGHYYLGRHYKKVLESERTLKPDDQSDEYLTGETAKLVIENYMRSLNYGVKYLYQTLPRVLTLWLELGAQVNKAPEGKISLSKELHHRRKIQLESLHKYLNKCIFRLPAYIFYTALPQLVARIAHPNMEVFMLLEEIIFRVVEAHPRQALWSLFAATTSRQTNPERRARGHRMMQKIRDRSKKVESGSMELKTLLRMGEKLAEQLLLACNNGDFQSNRTTTASITRDLNFNHKCTPCPLVVPIEICLTATLPTLTDNVKKHKAFSRDVILVQSFLDHVLVLGSLAKPRKLTARGSNGVNYGLLIKPKDDLRTDQRLMEFNGMINRSLKRDAESSRRQLYIKTYAVTPLNEECGIIEWVDGLKTLRDILLNIYRSRGIVPNYQHLAQMMKDAASGDKNTAIFSERVIGMFPPVLPNWFIAQFPNPSAWFAARLRYTRSCAVMSMVGTILGLGDRHGENVLLEEGNGGVFHVDFNCLFDKGLTFAQPERVPFRLTHNMVAAMGIYGYEGPFRQCSELTLSILRQQEETLMTILEAFIYDPTLDLQRDKRKKNEVVKLNPQSVVDSIKRKVRGLLPDESIPLGVEGQVEELIKQAVNPKNLTAMYIGWCPFL
ncbi:phosphatidyl inositol 3-kinase [Annulohypoxylon maeteangense]|uniref:phosphatidyl inositol 3-kinase n=1 Tax=Annulohypoxylon maeteangense TaxID=1927788 RepID=UPI0020073502|nr:phosphatidyl inositol 3-kinase [Annulohypoxylon maeteangense]KAI0883853.1 phosphatidyl inositol 3-kinase [Annulohypoxylon maeteangense]